MTVELQMTYKFRRTCGDTSPDTLEWTPLLGVEALDKLN